MAKSKGHPRKPEAVNMGGEIVAPITTLKQRLGENVKPGEFKITVNVGPSILSTPQPWPKDWLERHGLKVIYIHGHAELKFK